MVSCGNQAVLSAADYLEFLAGEDGVRSIALYLEDDGDGARLCEALAACAERGVRVALLKVGSSAAGATAAAAHTGALAGDQRVFRALVEEAGAVGPRTCTSCSSWPRRWRCRARRGRGGGLAILTCSGGDSSLGADEASRPGSSCPRSRLTRASGWASSCRAPPRSPTRSTTPR